MPTPKFTVPEIESKIISPATLKIYKARLNKLVPYGFKTIQDIQEHPEKVVEAINTIVESKEGCKEHKADSTCKCPQCKARESKRYFLSAIFYVLADTKFIKTPNVLYDMFQTVKQNYNSH